MTSPNETIEGRRKRLLWRASHRGMREMDVLLGGFARARIDTLSEAELDELEAIVGLPDQDLMSWILGEGPVPQGRVTATLKALLAYRP
jgi:antitoxin CptB